jgi:hypothetical protein
MNTRTKKNHKSTLVDLHWSHLGVLHRVTAWPEACLERNEDSQWAPTDAGEDELASGMVEVDATAWRRYLEYMPAPERTFVQRFNYGRLAALLMVARGPQLLADLDKNPALVPFLAAHASLRGMTSSHWEEVAAVHERGGIYAVLEWLGLPASRETFLILHNMIDPDVPRRLLEPLRTLLWRPMARFVLQRTPQLTDRQLSHFCQELAA